MCLFNYLTFCHSLNRKVSKLEATIGSVFKAILHMAKVMQRAVRPSASSEAFATVTVAWLQH